jgi:hypothetical protein
VIRLSKERGIPLVLLAVSLGAGLAWQTRQSLTGASPQVAPAQPGHTPDAATPHGGSDSMAAGEAARERQYERIVGQGTALIVIPGGDAALERRYREAVGAYVARSRGLLRSLATSIVTDREVGTSSLPADSLARTFPVLVGTPATNRVLRAALATRGVAVDANGFRLFDRRYDEPGDLLSLASPGILATAPTPGATTASGAVPFDHFALILAAVHDSTVLGHLARPGRGLWQADYTVWRGGAVARSGELVVGTDGKWRFDPRRDDDHLRFREEFEATLVTRTSDHVIILTPDRAAGFDDQTSLLRELDARVAEMTASLGLSPGAPITIVNYPDFETMGRCTGRMLSEWADPATSTVHRVLEEGHLTGDGIAEAEILLTRALGPLPEGWFRAGALTWLADRWLGARLRTWERTFPESGLGFDLADVARIVDEESSLLAWPLAGLAMDQLLGEEGAAGLPSLAAAVRNGDPTLASRLAALAFRAPFVGAPAELQMPRWRGFALETFWTGNQHRLPFLRGVCFAHDNSLERGYASAHAGQTLAYLADTVGVNAISVSPFGYIGGANDPVIRHPERHRGESGMTQETDESLLSVLLRARNRKQAVVLAPHLWGRVWCGEWGAAREEEWPRFFAEYRRFILHYAALAEYAGVDLLQIGKELGATTHREAEWRALIADIRRVYHGPIVYGANWDGEQERIAWWDAVDYIGVSQYTPLSESDNPSLAELTAAARGVAARLDSLSMRVGRPWLLTEIGYIAGSTAARRPWETPRDAGATPDLELQARCYEAALTAFQESPRSAGLFFWKWFTDLESNNAGRNRFDFAPYGKPAEEVLARIWRRESDSAPARRLTGRRLEAAPE